MNTYNEHLASDERQTWLETSHVGMVFGLLMRAFRDISGVDLVLDDVYKVIACADWFGELNSQTNVRLVFSDGKITYDGGEYWGVNRALGVSLSQNGLRMFRFFRAVDPFGCEYEDEGIAFPFGGEVSLYDVEEFLKESDPATLVEWEIRTPHGNSSWVRPTEESHEAKWISESRCAISRRSRYYTRPVEVSKDPLNVYARLRALDFSRGVLNLRLPVISLASLSCYAGSSADEDLTYEDWLPGLIEETFTLRWGECVVLLDKIRLLLDGVPDRLDDFEFDDWARLMCAIVPERIWQRYASLVPESLREYRECTARTMSFIDITLNCCS